MKGGSILIVLPAKSSATARTVLIGTFFLTTDRSFLTLIGDPWGGNPFVASFGIISLNGEGTMKKLRIIMGVLSVGLAANLLAEPAEATAAGGSRLACMEVVYGLCDAYCFQYGYENCVVHWEDRANCKFHVDSCY